MKTTIAFIMVTISVAMIAPAGAAEVHPMWHQCGRESSFETEFGQLEPLSDDRLTEFSADSGTVHQMHLFTLEGNVLMRHAQQSLHADKMIYDREQDTLTAEGHLTYRDTDLVVSGRKAVIGLDSRKGSVLAVKYRLLDRHARGKAKEALLDGSMTRFLDATFSTCNEEQEDWHLSAKELDLDRDQGIGVARHITMKIRHVPILYLPYMSFPLSERRKSGFLIPRFGGNEEIGTELNIPFYWNIAPNYDATLTPRIMSRRGVQLQSEVRYLQRNYRGQLNAEYLPRDQTDNGNRAFLSFRHNGTIRPRLASNIIFDYVSDKNYFTILGNSLSLASVTHLERRADLVYRGSNTSLVARVQGFQTVDPTIPANARPYQRLPQLQVNSRYPVRNTALNSKVTAEFVRFDRQGGVTGNRFSVAPGIEWRKESAPGFIHPQFTLNHTIYALDNIGTLPRNDPQRTVPIASLDSGLFFERDIDLDFQNTHLLHTLEPRLFYLYVPYRDQSDIPNFDSSLNDFNFTQLFRDNRFSGTDRIGDANQLSLSLTSRLIDRATGKERVRASVGQIRYFSDRRVTLPGQPIATDGSSSLVAEDTARFGGAWLQEGQLEWNSQTKEVDKATLSLGYRPDTDHKLNLAYRFRRDDLEQTDLAALWPIARRWHILGRWNYSIFDHRTLESLGGIQYDSCCWRLLLFTRSFVNDVQGNRNQSLFVQLELKGLTSVGESADKFLERGILGYSQ